MTKGNKNRSQAGGKGRDDVERKRDERARRNALKKEREVKEYLENDENFVSFANQLQAVGYKIKDIKGDGNCLFRALADQLDGDDSGHLRYRRITAKYLADHREEFEPFVEDNKSFDEHVKELRKLGTFGGNDSVVAFSRCHAVNIVIHQLNERCWVIQDEHCSASTSTSGELKELHVSYHNQNHYSSVRRIGDPDDGPAWLFNNQQKVKEKPVPRETKSKYSNDKSKLNDTEVYCEGAGLPDQSSDIAIIQAATGCEDSQLISETLSETNNDLDGTISYILQLQSFINIEEPKEDKGSLANLSVLNNIERTDKIDAEQHQDESNVGHVETLEEAEPLCTITDNSAMTRESQQPSTPNHGARPKVRQQNLHVSNRKRKQLAKQAKKTRRMEERREEARKKQEPQNLENHQTNQTLPIMRDLEALEI